MALKPTIDVLVVGAGPVGLVAALGLARDGHRRIEIIDEAERRTGLSYALALHPAALRTLEELGVAAALIARGNRVDRIALYDGAERRAELDLGALAGPHPFVLVVPQSAIEEVLVAALAEAGVEVRWRHRLRHLGGRAEAGVACVIDRIDAESSGYAVAKVAGVVGKSFEREVSWILGADGHASLVRRQLGIELRESGAAGTVAVFELEGERLPGEAAAPAARRELRIGLAGGLRSVSWPLPGDRTRLGFELPADSEPTAERSKERLPSIVPWLSSALDDGRLHELVEERLPWRPAPSGRLMWSVTVRFERALADAFGRGRVWLAGDAAHLAFPFGVQSMNRGIVEARELATLFGRVLAGAAPPAALAAHASERLERWRRPAAAATTVASRHDPWLAANAAGILEALPLSADDAERLFARPTSTRLA